MNLAPLPVDTITDLEWSAAVNVHHHRDLPGHGQAVELLVAVCGSAPRAHEVLNTINATYRALAVAAHPAGTFLGHGSHALPEHHPVDDRTPGAGEPSDPGTFRPVEPARQQAPEGRQASTTPRWTPADIAVTVFGWACIATIVVLLARGGW